MGLCLRYSSEEVMKVSIVGLGWLGEPLAAHLLRRGLKVKGSTTTPEKIGKLSEKGIMAYPFFLGPEPAGDGWEPLFETDVMVINIPPHFRSHPSSYHIQQIKALRLLIDQAKVPKVIFVSATSVYPDLNQEAQESDWLDFESAGNPGLLQAENLLRTDRGYDLTVLRLGGLLGDDRIPGLYVSGKDNVLGHPPVNYIHRQDAVRLIEWLIEKALWNDTYNGVTPWHPSRRKVYEKNAADLGFAPPSSYQDPPLDPWKKVSSQKILQTGFDFLYHPLHFPYII